MSVLAVSLLISFLSCMMGFVFTFEPSPRFVWPPLALCFQRFINTTKYIGFLPVNYGILESFMMILANGTYLSACLIILPPQTVPEAGHIGLSLNS